MTTTTNNTAVGLGAGEESVGIYSSCFFGVNSGKNCKTNVNNFYGVSCGLGGLNGCGKWNNIFGANGLSAINSTASEGNTGMGESVLAAATNCSHNSCFGYNSGNGISTGSNNVLLGKNGGTALSPSGNVTTGSNIICLGDSNITNFYSQVALTIVSDSRDKCDIESLDLGLDFINQLQPKKYKMNDRNKYIVEEFDESTGEKTTTILPNDCSKADTQHSIGLIAQDVAQIETNCGVCEIIAHQINDEKMGIKYEALIPILINAVKELKVMNEALTARIVALENV